MIKFNEFLQKFFWFVFTSLFSLFLFSVTVSYNTFLKLYDSYDDESSFIDIVKNLDSENGAYTLLNRAGYAKLLTNKIRDDEKLNMEDTLVQILSIVENIIKKEKITLETHHETSAVFNNLRTNYTRILDSELKFWRTVKSCYIKMLKVKAQKIQPNCKQGIAAAYSDFIIYFNAFGKELKAQLENTQDSFDSNLLKFCLVLCFTFFLLYFIIGLIRMAIEGAYNEEMAEKKKRKKRSTK